MRIVFVFPHKYEPEDSTIAIYRMANGENGSMVFKGKDGEVYFSMPDELQQRTSEKECLTVPMLDSSLYCAVITVVPTTGAYVIHLPYGRSIKDVTSDGLPRILESAIAEASGLRKISLTGISVRDAMGNKTKPILDIYAPFCGILEFKSDYEFCRTTPLDWKTSGIARKRIFTCSSILRCLIEKSPLFFKNGKEMLKLQKDGEEFWVFQSGAEPTQIESHILGREVEKAILLLVNAYRAPFTAQLRTILTGGDTRAEISGFFRRISKRLSTAEYNYLVSVVTKFPKVHDSREEFILNLANYLFCADDISKPVQYDYLSVKAQRVPARKGSNSLQMLLEM